MAVDRRSDTHCNGCGDTADSGIPGVFGCLVLFPKRAAENHVHGSLRVGSGMNDEAAIIFQLFNPVLNVCGGVAVGVLVGDTGDSTKETVNAFRCASKGSTWAFQKALAN